jgi:hypothetical protein
MYLSVNGHVIRKNAVHGTKIPPIRIAKTKSDKKPRYAREVKIIGPAKLIYDPTHKILACGARLVIQCEDVKILK